MSVTDSVDVWVSVNVCPAVELAHPSLSYTRCLHSLPLNVSEGESSVSLVCWRKPGVCVCRSAEVVSMHAEGRPASVSMRESMCVCVVKEL